MKVSSRTLNACRIEGGKHKTSEQSQAFDIFRSGYLVLFLLMFAAFDSLSAQKDDGLGNVSSGTNIGTRRTTDRFCQPANTMYDSYFHSERTIGDRYRA